MNQDENKKFKIAFIFLIVFIFFIILILTLFYIIGIERKLPQLMSSDTDIALRGQILSSEGYAFTASNKLYKATVDTRNINPRKRDLFVKLFSIYSGIEEKKIEERLGSNFGYVVLTYKLDSKSAKYVKQLSKKLFKLGVFISYEDTKNNNSFLHGMTVSESGEYRKYLKKDVLAPVIGHIHKIEKDGFTAVEGVNGLEKFYNDKLEPLQNGYMQGKRDIANNILFDRDSAIENRVDGYDIMTSISLRLQKGVENIIDVHRERTGAKEIITAVMESKTGKVIAISSSNRFDPGNIKSNKNLSIGAIRHTFEPGSVLKPITFALLLKEKRVNPYDIVDTHNGRFKIGNKVITDEHRYESLSAEDIIVHSSNVGIAILAQKLDEIALYQGLRDFGFSKKSGIDLPYELGGTLPMIYKLKNSVYKATTAYGYGLRANFMQLMKAYNVFNNNGRIVTPSIAEYIASPIQKKQKISASESEQVLDVSVAKQMNKILVKTVNEGTGQSAKTPGLRIGGKTGTAHIVKSGGYVDQYNSSFFGFANDQNHSYTIGVTVIEPQGKNYFASQTAVPVFKDIVDLMVKEKFLKPLK